MFVAESGAQFRNVVHALHAGEEQGVTLAGRSICEGQLSRQCQRLARGCHCQARPRCRMSVGNVMTPRALLGKIEELPPDKQAEVEDFVEFLSRRQASQQPQKAFPDDLLTGINEDREELRRTHGLFDTLPLIREFRESGGR